MYVYIYTYIIHHKTKLAYCNIINQDVCMNMASYDSEVGWLRIKVAVTSVNGMTTFSVYGLSPRYRLWCLMHDI